MRNVVHVHNCDQITAKYVVVRDCNNELWFYGQWDSLKDANTALKDVKNGMIVESKDVVSIL